MYTPQLSFWSVK